MGPSLVIGGVMTVLGSGIARPWVMDICTRSGVLLEDLPEVAHGDTSSMFSERENFQMYLIQGEGPDAIWGQVRFECEQQLVQIDWRFRVPVWRDYLGRDTLSFKGTLPLQGVAPTATASRETDLLVAGIDLGTGQSVVDWYQVERMDKAALVVQVDPVTKEETKPEPDLRVRLSRRVLQLPASDGPVIDAVAWHGKGVDRVLLHSAMGGWLGDLDLGTGGLRMLASAGLEFGPAPFVLDGAAVPTASMTREDPEFGYGYYFQRWREDRGFWVLGVCDLDRDGIVDFVGEMEEVPQGLWWPSLGR